MLLIRSHRFCLILTIVMFGSCCKAQFRALQQLPWYPKLENVKSSSSGDGSVLDLLEETLQKGNYNLVIQQFYPEAVRQGYQRNARLYDNVRRALRGQLKVGNEGPEWWSKMQQLYDERRQQLGETDYNFRYSLETNSWSDEQLFNERIAWMSSVSEMHETCYKEVLAYVVAREGRVDPVVVVQGMFAPQNRHDAAEKVQRPDQNRYAEIQDWLDIAETYMQLEHQEAFDSQYPKNTLMAVHDECNRVVEATMAREDLAEMQRLQEESIRRNLAQQSQQQAGMAYQLAREAYQQRQYATAWNHASQADASIPEVRMLKASILQAVGTQATQTNQRLAFWCAAYETGGSYMDSKQRQQLLSSIKTTLFMSPDLAGKRVTTSSPFSISQRIWTQAQARAL